MLTKLAISCWLSLASVADQVFSEFCDIIYNRDSIKFTNIKQIITTKFENFQAANRKMPQNVIDAVAQLKPIWQFKQVVVYGMTQLWY